MSRKTFDPDADVPMPPHGRAAEPLDDGRQACRRCGTLTLRSMLAQYGGRCLRCFDAYIAEPQVKPAALPDKRLGPKAWAWALKAREERDPRSVSSAQRAMWRAAIAPQLLAQAIADDEAVEATP